MRENFQRKATVRHTEKLKVSVVKHDGEFAHLGLGEAILEVVVVGVRADLVEAVHVRVEEESQVLVHVKDFRVLEHV